MQAHHAQASPDPEDAMLILRPLAYVSGRACRSLVKFATPALALFIIASASGASHPSSRSPGGAPRLAFQQAPPTDAELSAGEAAARAQCGTCHALPPPDILPRPAWRDEIARMLLIKNGQPAPAGPRGTAARIVRLPADWQSILKYYEGRAPERLDLPVSWPDPDDSLPFRTRAIPGVPGSSNHTANVRLIDGDRDLRPSVVVSDMRSGILYDVRPQDDSAAIVELARL